MWVAFLYWKGGVDEKLEDDLCASVSQSTVTVTAGDGAAAWVPLDSCVVHRVSSVLLGV